AFAAVPDGGATLLIQVVLMHFILPAILTLIIHEITIKLGWVKSEYLKLEAL
ncbi:MAG TPA: PTS sugar transporter subunit IIC, partial [Dielma fastidiosa]|nr:PTS sugar transporter subunit IIC [Dielma fastidiosa]